MVEGVEHGTGWVPQGAGVVGGWKTHRHAICGWMVITAPDEPEPVHVCPLGESFGEIRKVTG